LGGWHRNERLENGGDLLLEPVHGVHIVDGRALSDEVEHSQDRVGDRLDHIRWHLCPIPLDRVERVGYLLKEVDRVRWRFDGRVQGGGGQVL
jgi:hypothetical protein